MVKRVLLILILTSTSIVFAQSKKEIEEKENYSFEKIFGIGDRAAGIHNASNIGLFFENRGKLYPRRITQGPSGEFPINSTKHYIYRVNPWVGIPGNVVQGLHTTNEEWEAVGGTHNNELAQVAFSDNPSTWHPVNGWPIKDADGNNIIISDQDSYCVYSDSNNSVSVFGLQVAQTGYAFGINLAKNILFYKYEITNHGANDLSNLYFALYCDIDVGNVSGGVPEYLDDKIDFIKDRNLVYFHDDGVSSEWPGGKTGLFGISLLKTPIIDGQQLGVTDMHYNLYDDDLDMDSVQYGIMSSAQSLYNSSLGSRFFHIGNNTSLKFDDPATIPASGLDLVATLSSGPYNLNRGDTLVFITAFIGGETKDELLTYSTSAQNIVDAGFNLPKPPARPTLSGSKGNKKAILYWDDKAERSLDISSGIYDFEGYRLYRSNDKGRTWEKITQFDAVNAIGEDVGLQYSFTDTTVVNGFEYWYSITAYDQGNELIASLESPIGNTLESENTVSIIPISDAIGRLPVGVNSISRTGSGASNYEIDISPIDDETLTANQYEVSFEFVPRKVRGSLETKVTLIITDSVATKPINYGMRFNSPTNFDLVNLSTTEIIRSGYNYPVGGRDVIVTGQGLRITLKDSSIATAEQRPMQGDLISIDFAINAVKNNVENVIEKRPFDAGQLQSTKDGIIFTIDKPDIIKSVSRIGGNDNFNISFEVTADTLVAQNIYIVSVDANGLKDGNPFVVISVSGTPIVADTIFNLGTFTFNGVTGKINFLGNTPPSVGNKYSVEVIEPVELDIRDRYLFDIKGSSINSDKIKSEMNKIRVVPNPYVASSLFEPEFGELRKEPLRQIQFINLPPECTIYIFTVDANLIKTINHSSTSGTTVWDLRAEGGREIAPGVYIYIVKTSDSEFMERFAVIK
ncbi:MAG: hypothetical protein Q8N03_08550 [Ignavibacteria bacterium]|nr:hypothetical protein [Ignavibacteria bacterium]